MLMVEVRVLEPSPLLTPINSMYCIQIGLKKIANDSELDTWKSKIFYDFFVSLKLIYPFNYLLMAIYALIYFNILERIITICLRRQTRLDPVTEERYHLEMSTPLMYNFPLIYLHEFCTDFLAQCAHYLRRPNQEVLVA